MESARKCSAVVAMCNNRGIGKDGALPWRLKKEMKYFKELTTTVTDPGKQNAVVMGRNTWESIPAKFRPLAGRINIVISGTLSEAPKGAYLGRSFEDALDVLSREDLQSQVENVFIIGGHRVYKSLFASSAFHRLYLTRVLADIDCDTFLPDVNLDNFKRIQCPNVPQELQNENGIEYQYEVYEKTMKYRFNVVAAMSNNRGIGYKQKLPWPPVSKDYQHYRNLSMTTPQEDQYNIIIRGRQTWHCTCEEEQKCDKLINIVISSNVHDKPEGVHYMANSFDDALRVADEVQQAHNIHRIWVLGGQQVFEDAVNHDRCGRIYLTRFSDFYPSDRFFPEFEKQYTEIRLPDINRELQEENGTKYQFLVYEHIFNA